MSSIPFYLSLAFVFTIPWESAVTIGGIGTLTRLVGMCTVAIWLGVSLLQRSFRRPHLFHAAAGIYIFWNIMSLYWTVDPAMTAARIATYVQTAAFVYILWDLYRTPQTVRAALQAYILGAYVAVGSTLSNFLHGQQIGRYDTGRFAGAGANACELIMILALGLPIAWHLATTSGGSVKERLLQSLNYIFIPASLFAMTLTGTRTALLVVIPALFHIAGTTGRIRPLYRLAMFVAFLVVLFIAKGHIPQATFERLSTVGSSIEQKDLDGRVELWRESLRTFSDHPILGIGSGALCSPRELGTVAHNTFISVLTEQGLVGFLLFSFLLILIFYNALNQPGKLSGLWVTLLSMWCIGVSTVSWENTKPTWLIFCFVVTTAHFALESTEPRERLQMDTQSIYPR